MQVRIVSYWSLEKHVTDRNSIQYTRKVKTLHWDNRKLLRITHLFVKVYCSWNNWSSTISNWVHCVLCVIFPLYPMYTVCIKWYENADFKSTRILLYPQNVGWCTLEQCFSDFGQSRTTSCADHLHEVPHTQKCMQVNRRNIISLVKLP
jgi:hypothetical protein